MKNLFAGSRVQRIGFAGSLFAIIFALGTSFSYADSCAVATSTGESSTLTNPLGVSPSYVMFDYAGGSVGGTAVGFYSHGIWNSDGTQSDIVHASTNSGPSHGYYTNGGVIEWRNAYNDAGGSVSVASVSTSSITLSGTLDGVGLLIYQVCSSSGGGSGGTVNNFYAIATSSDGSISVDYPVADLAASVIIFSIGMSIMLWIVLRR